MNSRELVFRAAKFQGPDRLPYLLSAEYGSDFVCTTMDPNPDARPGDGIDEWGAIWQNIGISRLGQVKEFPLKDWIDFDGLKIPDVTEACRWEAVRSARESAPDKFLLGSGISLYERVHFLRGIENAWMDIYTNPDELARLLDILVDMNVKAISYYSNYGVDGYMLWDDWGLQDRLMIAPEKWRQIWKPRYAEVFRAAHDAGMVTFLHSCGYIADILDDLIEVGLEVIQMDQQENMGLDLLGEQFGGRIAFWCPVDIQNTMCKGSLDDIRSYAHRMVDLLGRPNGGFIAMWHADPVGAGHTQEAVDAMCNEFIQISEAWRASSMTL
ncbi:MAG: uroporphyrinogen decarboxylase family protein [Armatimonadota bacterium]